MRTRLLLAVQQCHTATTPYPKSRVCRRLSLATFVPRPLCLCVKVPRLSSYLHTLVLRFQTLCARAASSCQHSDYLAPLFRVSQQLPTMNRQVECNPTLEGPHMAFRLGWCHHGHHPSLRSARSPASLSKRVIRVTQQRTKPKTVPQKNKPCLLGLTESSSQRNPLPHKPPQPAEEPLDRHHLSFIRHMHPQTGDPPKKRYVGLPL